MSRSPGLGLRTEAGLAGIGLVTVLLFRRVFAGWSFLPELAAAVVLPILIGGVCRRVKVPVAGAAVLSVGSAGIFLAWSLFPATTAYAIPWAGTLTTAVHDARATWDAIATAVPPVHPDTGYLLLSAGGVWLLSVAADTLAVSWELPLVGLLPWVSLLAVIGAVSSAGPQTFSSLLFLSAALAYLGVSSTDERGRRARALTVEGRRTGLPVRGVGIAAGTLLIALVLSPAIPGFGSPALVRYKNGFGPGDRAELSPLVDIRFRLHQVPPIAVFTVQADQPSYWRTLALDYFNGQIWEAGALDQDGRFAGHPYVRVTGQLPAPTGAPAQALSQTFTIQGLSQIWLPAAYAPRTISVGNATVDPLSLAVATDRETPEGLRYTVESDVPKVGPDQLRAAGGPYPADIRAFDLQLPPALPRNIRDEALRLTANARTPFDKAIALRDYLLTFTYSLDQPAGHDLQTMESFLFRTKTGYCEQFAATMAAMARSLGIPARVAVGFVPGKYDAGSRTYAVTTAEAHAWVEIYFPTYGWISFNPTPGRNDPNPPDPGQTPPPGTDTTPTSSTEPATTTATSSTTPEQGDLGGGDQSQSGQGGTSRVKDLALGALLVAVVPVLASLLILATKALRRRARLRAPEGRRAQSLWQEICDLAVDAGLPIPSSETALETARRAAARFRLGEAALMTLAEANYGELFAPVLPPEEEADLRRFERELRKALVSGLSYRRRVVTRLSIASLRRRPHPHLEAVSLPLDMGTFEL
jgi:transglutaminase-like putative cysteine protease